MSVITEDIKSALNPQEEVKKLQNLVRKLEFQNQQLRNKENRPTKSYVKDTRYGSNMPNSSISKKNDSNISSNSRKSAVVSERRRSFSPEKCDKSTLEKDLINIDDLELSDEESWLYASPKSLSPEQKIVSPYKWLRKDVEDLENKELQLAKRALVSKLDELEILSPFRCTPTLQPQHPVVTSFRRPQVPVRMISGGQCPERIIDSRTFTRSKKRRGPGEEELSLNSLPVIDATDDNKGNKVIGYELESGDGVDGTINTNELCSFTNVMDIKEIARMQEESLRQSSPISTPKRQSASSMSSRRQSGSSRSSVSDTENQEPPVIVNSSHDDDCHYNTSTPVSGQMECQHSSYNSPPDSPFGSNVSLNNSSNNVGTFRRSLPNLARGYNGIRPLKGKHFSDSKLQKPFHVSARVPNRASDSQLPPPQFHRVESGSVPSPLASEARHPSPRSQQCFAGSYLESPPSVISSDANSTHPISIRHAHHALPIRQTHHPPPTRFVKSALPRPAKPPSTSRAKSGIPVPSRESSCRQNMSSESWSEGCY